MARGNGAQMNTRGPNGGKGAKNTVTTAAPTRPVRVTGWQVRPRAMSGDANMAGARSRNLDNQKPQTSRQSMIRQAAVNKGPFTDFSVSRQNLTQTKVPKGASYTKPAVNNGPFNDRSTKNTMSGKGKKGE